MAIPYRYRPSVGFVVLSAVLTGTVAFFAWGLSTPRLEEVWRLDIELGMGKRPALTPEERALLQQALIDRPVLADVLLEDKHDGIISANTEGRVETGYAYLIRKADDPAQVAEVSYEGFKKKGSVVVRARSADAEAVGIASRDEPFRWPLPPEGAFPQLVELRFESQRLGKKQEGGHHPVQIDLVGAP